MLREWKHVVMTVFAAGILIAGIEADTNDSENMSPQSAALAQPPNPLRVELDDVRHYSDEIAQPYRREVLYHRNVLTLLFSLGRGRYIADKTFCLGHQLYEVQTDGHVTNVQRETEMDNKGKPVCADGLLSYQEDWPYRSFGDSLYTAVNPKLKDTF